MARDRFPVVVHALIYRDEQVFLLRRAKTGFMDGFYCLPGGHQRTGESVDGALRRECEEETGIIVGAVEPVCVMPYRSGDHQGFNFVFEVKTWRGEPRVAEPEHFSQALWATPQNLPQPAAPWLEDVFRVRSEGRWFQELYWP